jgi:predicted chitinase/murein DD-endopeptidase MepM/ murein hydrolase activator NlpD
MLISPPFLPPRGDEQSEEDWLRAAMIEGKPGDGAFPVSFNFGWHGGVHLTAPITAGKSELVRAVADGKVIFLRKPTPRSSDKDHPLNYRGGWTDDGCVVIRHQTSIGNGPGASDICFYSIYMHLAEIDLQVKSNKSISRKDAIGYAGQIYGSQTRQIHFEIASDDINTKKLMGRLSGDIDVGKDGRVDAIYGEIYYCLPAGTPIFFFEPIKHIFEAQNQPPKLNKKSSLPPIVQMQPALLTSSAVIVGIATHPNAGLRNGDRRITTYDMSGEKIGESIYEVKKDYRLTAYAEDLAGGISKSKPVPQSALLEILRFGRIINKENETLPNIFIPHWLKISHQCGHGWVNLNANGVNKFSDADFPVWRGWSVIDDSSDGDSKCDSTKIRNWIFGSSKLQTMQIAASQLLQSSVLSKLEKAICKFPSEWSPTTVDRRWSWLKQSSPTWPTPLSEDDFKYLKQHVVALCFDLPEVHDAQWHWPTSNFIRHFRTCGWLSENELLRCIPAVYQMEKGERGSGLITIKISDDVAKKRIEKINAVMLMQVCRKYGIVTPMRTAHFLSQIFRETGLLQWFEERATGEDYEGNLELGNDTPGDGKRYKGRGLIQVTGRRNYTNYTKYRGRLGNESFLIEPNNNSIAIEPYNCADTAGIYWASRSVGGGLINLNCLSDKGVAERDLRAVTKNVNGAEDGKWTGLLERRCYLNVLSELMLDNFPVVLPCVGRKNV